MANVKITELTAATALAGTDVLPIVDVGADATKKVSVSDLLRNLPDGTASAPALAFADDQNTGVLSPGDNSLAFATSGTQRLVIDSSGRVGINNTNPGTQSSAARNLVIGTPGSGSSSGISICSSTTGAGNLYFADATSGGATGVGRISYDFSSNSLRFSTSASERLRIDSSGNLGVGTTSPGDLVEVKTGTDRSLLIRGNRNSQPVDLYAGHNGAGYVLRDLSLTGSSLQFNTGSSLGTSNTEKMRIDSSGRVLVGTSSAPSVGATQFRFNVSGENFADSGSVQARYESGSSGPTILHAKARGTAASPSIVQDDDQLGKIRFYGYDGSDFSSAGAEVGCEVDGTPGSNDMPGRLVFKTTADGASSPIERMRVDSSGNVGIGNTVAATIDGVNSAGTLVVGNGSSAEGVTIYTSNSTAGELAFADGTSGSATQRGRITYSHGDNSMRFSTDASEAVRIDSSSRVGIGTTSPGDYNSGANNLVVAGTGSEGITIATGTSAGGSIYFADGTSGNAAYRGYLEYQHSADYMRFGTAGLERMRIDSSGRLLLGTTSAPTGGDWAQYSKAIFTGSTGSTADAGTISLKRGGTAASGNPLGVLSFSDSNGGEFAYIKCEADGTTGSSDYPGRLMFSTTADGASSPTERMRIDSSGQVLIGRSSGISDTPSLAQTHVYRSGSNDNYALAVHHDGNNSANYGIYVSCGQDAGNGWPMRIHDGNGTLVGSITFSGSSTAFNTSSDYRLKENVVDLDGAITRVKQLQPKRFNFISAADTTVDGFLAHEAQTVVPEAVTGTHNEVDNDGNAVMQGIDQSKLVPLLTAALQEAIAKIETLETKVAALEAQ